MRKINVSIKVALQIREAIQGFLLACGNLKGGVIMDMHINLTKMAPTLDSYDKAYRNIIDKYCKKDKKGQPIFKELGNGAVEFEFEENRMKKADAEYQELLGKEIEIELKTIGEEYFRSLEIDTSKIKELPILVEYVLN